MSKWISKSLSICYFIIIFQGISLLVYTSIALVGALITGEIERVDTFVAENLLYLLLIFLILTVAFNFKKHKRASFTPFLLIQMFALIIAWPLLQNDNLITQALGLLIGLSGLIGIFLGLLPVNRKKFL
jgi:Na+-transporting methylmalonyl-CoA/oxaloacetate decarboxylase beta subunit